MLSSGFRYLLEFTLINNQVEVSHNLRFPLLNYSLLP